MHPVFLYKSKEINFVKMGEIHGETKFCLTKLVMSGNIIFVNINIQIFYKTNAATFMDLSKL